LKLVVASLNKVVLRAQYRHVHRNIGVLLSPWAFQRERSS
jgi:hypothetical protein